MRTRSVIGLILGLPGLLLAACEGEVPKTVVHFKRTELVESLFVYASKEGPVLAQIHGTPFPSRENETVEAVLEAFTRAVTWRKVAFTNDPLIAIRPAIRVVLAFNAPASTDGRSLCRGEVPEFANDTAGGEIRVQAVFCSKDEMVSEVTGRIKMVSGPGDKLFVKLAEQVARDLLDHR